LIVVDTNALAYLLLGGTGTAEARGVYIRDPVWHSPLLWRSEFRSVLAVYLRQGTLTLDDALAVQRKAEELLAGREHVVPSDRVLRLVAASSCSAYDCEFVALAQQLMVPLVTADRAVLKDFPAIAVSPARFLEGRC
jgi:predicted nucleic acid-binding protein